MTKNRIVGEVKHESDFLKEILNNTTCSGNVSLNYNHKDYNNYHSWSNKFRNKVQITSIDENGNIIKKNNIINDLNLTNDNNNNGD